MMRKYLKLLTSYRLGWFLLATHLVCVKFVFLELPEQRRYTCDEGILSHPLDVDIAGRSFLFNHSSPFARGMLVINLPALVVAGSVTHLVFFFVDDSPTGMAQSWCWAFAFLITTAIQWLTYGQLISYCLAMRRDDFLAGRF
jgi:hypothetical protein